MSRCTERDRRFYDFLVKTRLPMTITDVAHMFYPSPSGNERSSITIAQRRCRELKKMQYIEISNRSFGSCNYYYVGSKPNERSLRHRLLMSHVIATISCNGFNIIDIEIEKSFMDGELRSDIYMIIEYNKTKYCLLCEIDLTKPFNTDGYTKLLNKVMKGEIKFPYQLILLSVSDMKLEESDIKKYITQVDTELKSFNKFLWKFIK